VATAKAQIKTAEAAVETAKLDLLCIRLTSPIYDVAGQAQLQVGDLVYARGALSPFSFSGFIFSSVLFPQRSCCLRVASCARELAAYYVAGSATLAV
jgi:hypothetical protein